MKLLLKINSKHWELYCTIARYLQLHREREREKVRTAVTFRVVMLSKSVTTPIR
jgi:hypothetical protein